MRFSSPELQDCSHTIPRCSWFLGDEQLRGKTAVALRQNNATVDNSLVFAATYPYSHTYAAALS